MSSGKKWCGPDRQLSQITNFAIGCHVSLLERASAKFPLITLRQVTGQ